MEALLRETRESSDGIGEYRDLELSAACVTLGSAPDRSIQLLGKGVLPEHAQFELRSDGRLRLTCARGATVSVNDDSVKSANVSPGDRIRIGGNCITVFEPPAGFDAGVQVVRDAEVDPSALERAFRTDLNQVWLSKRAATWVLSAAVAILAFVLPFLASQGKLSAIEGLPFFPRDVLWSSGPLLPAHELAVGGDCRTCHQAMFRQVQDAACLECHDRIRDHVDRVTLVDSTSLATAPRCAACHREHNEPDPHIVIRADALCTDCHGESEKLFGTLGVQPVGGFSRQTHPAFNASLYRPVVSPAGTGVTFDWETVVEPVSSASEASNLMFPHDLHLDPAKVTDLNSGESLGCTDCHRLSLDREHFLPITMQNVCIGCHELTFDPSMPDRQLPHGKPLEVIMTLEGQYLRKFSDPAVDNKAVRPRRIPDKDNTTRVCVGTAFDCAAEAAAEDIREQFAVRGCVSCHVVEEHPVDDVYSRYQVHPVRLAVDYFPPARFDHASHLVMKDATGDAACAACHDARTSSLSSDLLIPDIDACVECHADYRKAESVPLQCIDCHGYHPLQAGTGESWRRNNNEM
jgi:predicted CXXCH cytochrome family protein